VAFAFWCSSNTALQTSTHLLQMYTRPQLSAGFAISVSTWSWVLLQNEHRRISSWRLKSMNPVWRERRASQDWLLSKSALLGRAKVRCCSTASKDLVPRKPKDCFPGWLSGRNLPLPAWAASCQNLNQPVFTITPLLTSPRAAAYLIANLISGKRAHERLLL